MSQQSREIPTITTTQQSCKVPTFTSYNNNKAVKRQQLQQQSRQTPIITATKL